MFNYNINNWGIKGVATIEYTLPDPKGVKIVVNAGCIRDLTRFRNECPYQWAITNDPTTDGFIFVADSEVMDRLRGITCQHKVCRPHPDGAQCEDCGEIF